MGGGYLNLSSVGNQNMILTSNPTKTFFKAVYSKYANFGMQKFRLDYDGCRDLRLTEESKFVFKVKKYADLLMDTYVAITLPNIWSPIYNPCAETDGQWSAYDFRWIDDIGAQMIKCIEITCGSQTLQKYSGAYLSAMIDRDFTTEKKHTFNEMSGNIPAINNPAFAYGRENAYPSAYYTSSTKGAEPSIRGKTLYIPINTWFTLNSRCSFPLLCLPSTELTINITFRPIQELFQIRDVLDVANQFPYIQPDFNKEHFKMYRFLQTPPAIRIDSTRYSYQYVQQIWNADIHLVSTYCFLSPDEIYQFKNSEQMYLIKSIQQSDFLNITGAKRIQLENSTGLISNWMFYLQRSDVQLRNEWNNYSNWPYKMLPSNLLLAPQEIPSTINDSMIDSDITLTHGPGLHPSYENTNLFITGDFSTSNQHDILLSLGILMDGEYREHTLPSGIYNHIEKYTRTASHAKDGLFCYNFCLSTNPYEYQPSGAMNVSQVAVVEFETTTFLPGISEEKSTFKIFCNREGQPVGVSTKQGHDIYEYNFNMTVFEERYNVLTFSNGNATLLYTY